MIDPNWRLEDLDPRTWRAIGAFFDPGLYIRAGTPGERGLFVAHDSGRLLNVVDTSDGVRRDFDLARVEDPAVVARSLYERGEWDRVHVIDRKHLEAVAAQAQHISSRELTLDAYYRKVFHLIWGDGNGYVAVPPRPAGWNGWTYEAIRQFVDRFQQPASLALGVIDDGTLVIGLIAEVSGGMIRAVTTFEALPLAADALAVSERFLDQLWSAMAERIQPPGAVVLCTSTVFDAWVYQPEKASTIRRAIDTGEAVLRLREDLPLAPSAIVAS
jgi:hypothetical protein